MQITITREEACDRIELFAAEGRLVQNAWHSQAEDGSELACLLGAIAPEVRSGETCPAEVMPRWMAHVLPTLFDGVAAEDAVGLGVRFAGALRTGNTDDEVMRRWLIRLVEGAVDAARPKSAARPTYWREVEAACAGVVAAIRDNVGVDAAAIAAKQAEQAVYAAEAEDAARAAGAAKAAMYAAKQAEQAVYAADAVFSAMYAAGAEDAVYAAVYAAEDAVYAATYKRLFEALIEEMLRP